MVDVDPINASHVLKELRSEIRAISQRLSRLESAVPSASAALAVPTTLNGGSPQSKTTISEPWEPISEDVLLVISAAVAAFLGERAHLRQVRLMGSPVWVQQGRVSLQASHNLYRAIALGRMQPVSGRREYKVDTNH